MRTLVILSVLLAGCSPTPPGIRLKADRLDNLNNEIQDLKARVYKLSTRLATAEQDIDLQTTAIDKERFEISILYELVTVQAHVIDRNRGIIGRADNRATAADLLYYHACEKEYKKRVSEIKNTFIGS